MSYPKRCEDVGSRLESKVFECSLIQLQPQV